ncbi:hypothetical protein THTE_0646 [Thermogutta terrifontis]|uniref:Uncharacterized protein n=1 Tax=Thermogutta terrifontis TaxID=1331910 RepID=A0A286RBA8_9BACT|nr:hypothetical protein [Thermogutta terrifontis]ASV73248.1 hypothetical protein THTE_0646 [Thermogutta terrifontis]
MASPQPQRDEDNTRRKSPPRRLHREIVRLRLQLRDQLRAQCSRFCARRREILTPAFQNGLGLALVVGGGIWLLAAGHPLALALLYAGLAIWLATRENPR